MLHTPLIFYSNGFIIEYNIGILLAYFALLIVTLYDQDITTGCNFLVVAVQ
jgi:hypothetical protein